MNEDVRTSAPAGDVESVGEVVPTVDNTVAAQVVAIEPQSAAAASTDKTNDGECLPLKAGDVDSLAGSDALLRPLSKDSIKHHGKASCNERQTG